MMSALFLSLKGVNPTPPFPLKYPIGQQDSRHIRDYGFVYIDKTDLIYQLVNDLADPSQLASYDLAFLSLTAMMYQTGYLTIKGYDKEEDLYRLGIPKVEIEKSLTSSALASFLISQNQV